MRYFSNWLQVTQKLVLALVDMGKIFTCLHLCRTNSKTALAKDLVEGIEKDLEKLRRQQENLQLRKTLALNGGQSIIEET